MASPDEQWVISEDVPESIEVEKSELDRDPGKLSDSVLEEVAGGAGVLPPDGGRRGGWDGNHIETMRRVVPSVRA